MANNNNKKSTVIGYTAGGLTLAALGVTACVKGDKALELTEEQKKHYYQQLMQKKHYYQQLM